MSSEDETYEVSENVPENWRCGDCSVLRVRIEDGRIACPSCGDVQDGAFVPGRQEPKSTKKKSQHSRVAWMTRKLSGLTKDSPDPVVESRFVDSIAHDFALVERVMRDKDLIKGRNMSRYDYYIIRLCSRVGTKPLVELKDLKDGGKARAKFDNNLYGVVYPELDWGDDNDEYYVEWCLKTGQDPV